MLHHFPIRGSSVSRWNLLSERNRAVADPPRSRLDRHDHPQCPDNGPARSRNQGGEARGTQGWTGGRGGTREQDVEQRRAGTRKNEGGYYFAVSYKYSFLLADESGGAPSLALQAVSRVKSANERPLQPRGESFALLALLGPHRRREGRKREDGRGERGRERRIRRRERSRTERSETIPLPSVAPGRAIPRGNHAAR